MNEAIEDGVGEGRVLELAMPVRDRQLEGYNDRASAEAVVEDFEQIAPARGFDGRQAPVVEDQEVDAGEVAVELGDGALAMGDAQIAPPWWAIIDSNTTSLARWASATTDATAPTSISTLVLASISKSSSNAAADAPPPAAGRAVRVPWGSPVAAAVRTSAAGAQAATTRGRSAVRNRAPPTRRRGISLCAMPAPAWILSDTALSFPLPCR